MWAHRRIRQYVIRTLAPYLRKRQKWVRLDIVCPFDDAPKAFIIESRKYVFKPSLCEKEVTGAHTRAETRVLPVYAKEGDAVPSGYLLLETGDITSIPFLLYVKTVADVTWTANNAADKETDRDEPTREAVRRGVYNLRSRLTPALGSQQWWESTATRVARRAD